MYWKYFIEDILLCVCIFCRLITKIVTLKKEVNELRKQQLLQSSDERYDIQFHWLPFFTHLSQWKAPLNFIWSKIHSSTFDNVDSIVDIFNIGFVIVTCSIVLKRLFQSSSLRPSGQFQYQICGSQWDFRYTSMFKRNCFVLLIPWIIILRWMFKNLKKINKKNIAS